MSDRSSSKDSFYTIRNARPDDAGRIKELYIQLSGDVSNADRALVRRWCSIVLIWLKPRIWTVLRSHVPDQNRSYIGSTKSWG